MMNWVFKGSKTCEHFLYGASYVSTQSSHFMHGSLLQCSTDSWHMGVYKFKLYEFTEFGMQQKVKLTYIVHVVVNHLQELTT